MTEQELIDKINFADESILPNEDLILKYGQWSALEMATLKEEYLMKVFILREELLRRLEYYDQHNTMKKLGIDIKDIYNPGNNPEKW